MVRRKETTPARERHHRGSDARLGITAGALPLSRRGRGTRGTPALKAPASISPGLVPPDLPANDPVLLSVGFCPVHPKDAGDCRLLKFFEVPLIGSAQIQELDGGGSHELAHDLSRFRTPRELMGYLGLVPSESSTGDTVNRGGITKAGNGRARRILVEAAWSYRHPPRVSCVKQIKVAAAPRAVREIAWKAQMRLCGRFRSLARKGKRPTVVATAIARELSAFIWAINREVVGSHATANQ